MDDFNNMNDNDYNDDYYDPDDPDEIMNQQDEVFLHDGMHTLDDDGLDTISDSDDDETSDGDGDDDNNRFNAVSKQQSSLSKDEIEELSKYGPTGANFNNYRNIENERGFSGSRHDFKRTKPLYTDEQFHAQPLDLRVALILSDGQWYDSEKLRKLCRHDDIQDIQDIVDDMLEQDMIVASDSGESYRMTYNQLYDWRMHHGIPLDAQIIQSILYPRLITIGSKTVTEQEVFLPVKRHKFGSVKFTLRNDADIDDIIDNLGYIGRFVQIELPYRWAVICLSADWAKKKLEAYERERGGKGHVFVDTKHDKPSIYNNGLQRDLNEIDPRAIDQIVRFYQTFQTTSANGELRPAILQQSSYKTLQLYLNDCKNDSGVLVQLNKWIIDAIQHYDERCGSPFAAYLTMVANRRVNDIPKTIIGDELAEFQNIKSKVVKSLNKDNGEGEWYSTQQIIERMHRDYPNYDITEDKFNKLDDELSTWKQMKHMDGLQWDETGEEKRFKPSNTVNSIDMQHDITDTVNERNANVSRIQHAIVQAAILSNNTRDARLMLMMLANSSSLGSALMNSMSALISDDYRDSLAMALAHVKYE